MFLVFFFPWHFLEHIKFKPQLDTDGKRQFDSGFDRTVLFATKATFLYKNKDLVSADSSEKDWKSSYYSQH